VRAIADELNRRAILTARRDGGTRRPSSVAGWPRTPLAKVNQLRRGFTGIFEVGVGPTSLESEMGRGPVRRASRAVVCASRDRGDPPGALCHNGWNRAYMIKRRKRKR
jgi:hypothetical protein